MIEMHAPLYVMTRIELRQPPCRARGRDRCVCRWTVIHQVNRAFTSI